MTSMNKVYYVYHIKRRGMALHEGYIGISKHPDIRLKSHLSKHCHNQHLQNAINKYDDIEMVVLLKCSEDYAKQLEKQLRPNPKMGWNIVPGGGKPPVNRFFGDSNPMRRPEVAAKHSKAMTGRTIHNNEGVAKMAESKVRCQDKLMFIHKDGSHKICRPIDMNREFHSRDFQRLAKGLRKSCKGWSIKQ